MALLLPLDSIMGMLKKDLNSCRFCKKSLHSVAEKGEKRCPKCRQLISQQGP